MISVEQGNIGERGVSNETVLDDQNVIASASLRKELIKIRAVGTFERIIYIVCTNETQAADLSHRVR